jgi:hypothetical protein
VGAKKVQHLIWTDRYIYSTGHFDVTLGAPIYSTDAEGRTVFVGVLGADYRLEDISNYWIEDYNKTTFTVGIYKYAKPHYMIGVLTGSVISKQVLAKDPPNPAQKSNQLTGNARASKPPSLSLKAVRGISSIQRSWSLSKNPMTL